MPRYHTIQQEDPRPAGRQGRPVYHPHRHHRHQYGEEREQHREENETAGETAMGMDPLDEFVYMAMGRHSIVENANGSTSRGGRRVRGMGAPGPSGGYRVLSEQRAGEGDLAEENRDGEYLALARLLFQDRLSNRKDEYDAHTFTNQRRLMEASVKIRHWQLRDLVRCPFAADDVFVVAGDRVNRYDVGSQKLVDTRSFMFEPTCFGFGGGFLGVGGDGSDFAVQRIPSSPNQPSGLPDEDAGFSGHIEEMGHVNNSVKITKDVDGKMSLFLCNNSGSIKILNGLDSGSYPMTLTETSEVHCRVPVNYCAIEEYNRSLLHVGDDNVVYLHDATPSGYQLTSTFSEARDAGMSCDWSPSGLTFAAASQDGSVCIWDRRSKELVEKLHASRAVRSVKFSPVPLDLLAFSEHRGFVHLVDCRMWSRRQIIQAQEDSIHDPDICGFDFSPCGRNLYVGRENAMEVLQLDLQSRKSFPFIKTA